MSVHSRRMSQCREPCSRTGSLGSGRPRRGRARRTAGGRTSPARFPHPDRTPGSGHPSGGTSAYAPGTARANRFRPRRPGFCYAKTRAGLRARSQLTARMTAARFASKRWRRIAVAHGSISIVAHDRRTQFRMRSTRAGASAPRTLLGSPLVHAPGTAAPAAPRRSLRVRRPPRRASTSAGSPRPPTRTTAPARPRTKA